MVMHDEKLALDEIGLGGPAQADGHIGLAHGEIEFAVLQQKRDADLRIEFGEFLDARREPDGAQANGRGDAQFARGLFL